MMRPMATSLQCHPQSAAAVPPSFSGLDVSVAFVGDIGLAATYVCGVSIADVCLPPQTLPGMADELWRHTCCELFVGQRNAPDYREFNFSPSGQWAAYRFSAYRERRYFLPDTSPQIQFSSDADGWRLQAMIPATLLATLDQTEIELSVATILESADGRLSYWALIHPRENPDFHHRGGFILRGSEIPAI